jgi:hypothetical protein
MVSAGAPMAVTEKTIPKTPDIAKKTVVLVNPPADLFAAFFPFVRAARGEPCPRLRWLASTTEDVEVRRLDARTLRVEPKNGFFEHITEALPRSKRYALTPGTKVDIAGLTITMAGNEIEGRPSAAVFTFDVPLDDPSLVWLRWSHTGYAPFEVPAIGDTVVLKGEDFFHAVEDAMKATK